ncbi:hypothetical protein Tco_0835705 [Tanacetum coccineum]
MEDDLFTYEVGVLEPSYVPCVEQQYADLENGDLDIFESRQCYDEYERMFAEVVILIDNRRLEVTGINTDVECDPTNVEFAKWLASKFNNHKTMEWYTKNALWLYWKRGDDDKVLTYDEFFVFKEENLRKDNEIAEIFRIEMDIFNFERPLCKESKEFNHLLHIDVDVLNGDLPGFKTYYFNSKVNMLNGPLVTGERMDIKEEEKLSEGAWSNHLPSNHLPNDEGINNDNDAIKANQELFNDHEPMEDDDDIGNLEKNLTLFFWGIPNDASYYVDEKEKRFKERRSKLLRIPYMNPPTFKSKKFEVIEYSFGPAEEYVAIKEYEYDIWLRTEKMRLASTKRFFTRKMKGGP